MNCLIIIPDLTSGSGSCCKAVAEEFKNSGHNVVILTRCADDGSLYQIISYFDKERKTSRIVLSIKRIILYIIWPFISLSEYRHILSNAKKIVESQNIDTIITAYNPIESVLAGHVLKKKFKHIKFIPYFLDALSAGPTPKFMPKRIMKRLAKIWENQLLKNADAVVMMKATENFYNNNKDSFVNFDKIKFLDLPLYQPKTGVSNRKRKNFDENQIILFFAGATPRNIRNPEYLLQVISKIKSKKFHLFIAGKTDYYNCISTYIKKCPNIHYLGELSYSKIKEMNSEADYLVNIGNSLDNMVPSKIFEYMSLGKPIISTVKIEKDPSIPYLKEYSNYFLLNEDDSLEHSIKLLENYLEQSHDIKQNVDLFTLNKPSTFVKYIQYIVS